MPRNPLPSRTQAWEQVGLGAEVSRGQARRARRASVVLLLLISGTIVLFALRNELFPGLGKPIRYATVVLLVIFGWGLARELGRGVAPTLLRHMEPGAAGSIGFAVRLILILAFVIAALRIAGLGTEELALGGAFTAVIIGLAAQQTIGNLVAGLVLVSARPFKVGDRMRLHSGFLGGQIEGVVSAVNLLHTALVTEDGRVLVPNSMVMNAGLQPLSEPHRVELTARLDASVTPEEVKAWIVDSVTVPLRYPPDIELEEMDDDKVTVSIRVVPDLFSDSDLLAAEVQKGVRAAGWSAGSDAGSTGNGGSATTA